ncbi:hypothetical protein QTG56_24155 (plasmid) [Rossellomorea sp. AcN35-11]|nr:hypothetical protein [Rossellomorea aquimaris]WJV31733.1 hypothetical protein QTG56_24155 [Rossellomorea sp. AcN35-11]
MSNKKIAEERRKTVKSIFKSRPFNKEEADMHYKSLEKNSKAKRDSGSKNTI